MAGLLTIIVTTKIMNIFFTVKKKPLLHKSWLIMKLIIALLFVTLQVSANGFGQEKITINAKDVSIAGVLSSIEKNTHYRFLYNNNNASFSQKISIAAQDENL